MIFVHKASVLHEGDNIRICCEIDVDEERRSLYFVVDAAYENDITIDRADAFLVMLFYFAMRDGHDLAFESPLSEQLLYQVQTYLVDALHKANPSYRRISITCPHTEREHYAGTAVGTAMSCGADSLFTLYMHLGEQVPSGLRVTHLAFFNVGGFQYDDGLEAVTSDGENLFARQLLNAQACAAEAGLPILVVNSNLGTCFPVNHIFVHAFRNCGTILLFQKLFNVYYYSSGLTLNQFSCSPDDDAAHYDLFSAPMLSTESTRFYQFSPSCGKFEKIAAIKDDPLTQKYLLVCPREERNCGTCIKCTRVLTALDGLNALPDFSGVFDLKQYQKTRTFQIGFAVANRRTDRYKDIYVQLIKERKIPLLSWVYATGFWLLHPLEKWLLSLPADRKRVAVHFAKKMNIRLPW